MASGELLHACYALKSAILLIQEPSTIRTTTVCGLGTTANRILVGTTTLPPQACIVITDPSIDVLHLSQFDTQYCVCAQVTDGARSLYVISLYLPPNISVLPISTIFAALQGHWAMPLFW